MYLKKVYQHSKLLFAGILFFMAAQTIVSVKHGLLISPWYNYGMYSAVQRPQPIYRCFIATVDGDTLKGYRYSPVHWDKLTDMPVKIEQTLAANHFYITEVKRLFSKFGFQAPPQAYFLQPHSKASLYQWNANYLQDYFKMDHPVLVSEAQAKWDGKHLILTAPAQSVSAD